MATKKKSAVVFHGEECTVSLSRYPSGASKIQLYDAEGFPYATASADIPGVSLAAGEVIIKDHSENKGMLQALTDAGLVQTTGKTVRYGFVDLPIVRLNE